MSQETRLLRVPLQNGGDAIFPVPMSPLDYALLQTILRELKNVHVLDLEAKHPPQGRVIDSEGARPGEVEQTIPSEPS